MLPVAILAGGLGSRLRDVTRGAVPKALVVVDGRPFIDFKLAGLAQAGVTEVVMLVGELGELVLEHVGDGARYGLTVRYVTDGPALLGTGGAVRAALDALPDAFWATYADTYLTLDMRAAEHRFIGSDLLGLMAVLRNQDRWQPSNVRVVDGLVASYSRNPPPGTHEFIDYGISLLRRAPLLERPAGSRFDLGEVFSGLAEQRVLGAFEVSERFRDVGTPEDLADTERYFAANATWADLAAGLPGGGYPQARHERHAS